MINHTYF